MPKPVSDELRQMIDSAPAPELDYKILLGKYLAYVGECEGTNFVMGRDYDDAWSQSSISRWFTREEWSVLQELSE